MTFTKEQLPKIIEAALMASGHPLSIDQMLSLFFDDQQPSRDEIREALDVIAEACEGRGVELKQVGSGYRFQAKQDYAQWIARLWEEKPPRYSRALLETLALVAYRQPITRSEIEDVRGVSVSSHIIKTLLEREWVRVVGHRDVPGKPALYATTKHFLDYFNIKSLEELPTLQEIRDLDKINAELDLADSEANGPSDEESQSDTATRQDADTQALADDAVAEDQPGVEGEVQQTEASPGPADEGVEQDEVEEINALHSEGGSDDAVDEDQPSVEGEVQQAEASTGPADEGVEQDEVEEIGVLHSEEDSDEANINVDEVPVTEEGEKSARHEAQSDEDEDAEEMLYADGHEDEDDQEAMDDKYAGTSSKHSIAEPDEPRSAISDAAEPPNALKA